ncbi:MAG: hypothetical protein K6T87_15775 [Roseiflexus sp.]|uniref:hypothetical protein n=1 Tax=Roseiflexus sp. TaxID=2562120 RepID=UPI0025E74EDA|nr:hypothetical protein [Roseiflexus sp.]MCL6542014.1 hypothetical protein [Roseiflexus sp.]
MIHEQVTSEDWRMLCSAPLAVGWYMATATGGKVQEVRELLMLRMALHRALECDPEHDLIGAVAATILSETPSDARWTWQPDDRPAMLRAVADAGAIASRLPSGLAFRRWLMDLAHEVAASEPDGGWLGIGARAVHEAEQVALIDLMNALGLLDGK